jgi:hypothetical protein
MSGTSMAAPHIAGLAALVVSCGITDPAKVRQRIRDTALNLGASGPDQLYGYGIARADLAALNCGGAATPAPVTDLSLGSLAPPSPAVTNVASWVRVVLTNTGNQSASGFTVTLRDNNVVVGTLSVPALLAGANTTLNFAWTPGAIGTHTLAAALDSQDGNAANNSASASVQVIAAPTISLRVTTSSSKNKRSADLTWSGAVGANVTVVRGGSSAATITTANDGSYSDAVAGKNVVNYTYQVCQSGTTLCSNTVAVTF